MFGLVLCKRHLMYKTSTCLIQEREGFLHQIHVLVNFAFSSLGQPTQMCRIKTCHEDNKYTVDFSLHGVFKKFVENADYEQKLFLH